MVLIIGCGYVGTYVGLALQSKHSVVVSARSESTLYNLRKIFPFVEHLDTSNLDEVISEANRLVRETELVAGAVKSCDREKEIVVLGRGFTYANTREAALKIQETSKISVQGLSVADYMHGPISALTDTTQVILLMPNGLPSSSIKDDVERIRAFGPRIIWFGNPALAEGNEIVVAGANCSNEINSSIVDSIILQRFALEFARKNGLNPDSPEGLSKVTLTI